ncbi:hypothetical protein M427DRAFT_141752 [Gonapodya prolifera JEL478]|uniref:Uncharacterized protein n=1 Tax=Gonapodya prolifera (strain JEL478) TaxID=1344416 RepID=A0A139B0E7_GONPJ|nr:hypothetical protein M427DRAFT_141752 [Gonapodya prolifera JEL478]|eukprot:KXS22175.1 hypothetical protein M427DRAFT_141752 [Gonapodya prolifera JEL478]
MLDWDALSHDPNDTNLLTVADKNAAVVSACKRGLIRIIELLLSRGADMRTPQAPTLSIGKTPASYVKQLIAFGADVHAQNGSALINAITKGDAETTRVAPRRRRRLQCFRCVRADCGVQTGEAGHCEDPHDDTRRQRPRHRRRALRRCLRYGHISVAKHLVAHRADPPGQGDAALARAKTNACMSWSFCCPRRAGQCYGNHPLEHAVANVGLEVVRLLLDFGADVHAREDEALLKSCDAEKGKLCQVAPGALGGRECPGWGGGEKRPSKRCGAGVGWGKQMGEKVKEVKGTCRVDRQPRFDEPADEPERAKGGPQHRQLDSNVSHTTIPIGHSSKRRRVSVDNIERGKAKRINETKGEQKQ